MSLATVAAALQGNNKGWDDLSASEKQDMRDSLGPGATGFSPAQRTWFRNWWLLANSGQITAINNLLPARTRVQALSHGGNLYLSIDLLTDTPDSGKTYHAARTVIQTLKATFLDPPP